MAQSPKNVEARIQALGKQLEDDPTSAAFFPLANFLWAQGEADRAGSVLTNGLQNHPSYLAPRVLLAEIYLAGDKIEDAAGELKKVVEKTPWNLTAQKLLLECRRKEGDEEGARQSLVAIGMFDPSNEAARLVIDEGVSALSPEEEAAGGNEAPLEESVGAVPTPSLAELYLSQGHRDKALDVYRKLLEEDPENEEYIGKISGLEGQTGEAGDGDLAEELASEASVEEAPAKEVLGNDEIDIEAMLAEAGDDASGEAEDLGSAPEEPVAGEADSGEVAEGAATEDAAPEISEEAPAKEVLGNDEIDIEAMLAEAGDDASGADEVSDEELVDEEAAVVETEDPDSGDGVDADAVAADADADEVTDAAAGEEPSALDEPSVLEEIGEEVDPAVEAVSASEEGEAESPAEDILAEMETEEIEPSPVADGEGAGDAASAEEPVVEEAAAPPTDEISDVPHLDVDESALIGELEIDESVEALDGTNIDFVEDLSEGIGLEASGELLSVQGLEFAGEAEPRAPASDSVLRDIVEIYIQEGAYRQALDICRKAEDVGERSSWLDSQIRYLEEISRSSKRESLPETPEGDNKSQTPSSMHSSEVVRALEGWLRTVRRRKAELSAGSEGE